MTENEDFNSSSHCEETETGLLSAISSESRRLTKHGTFTEFTELRKIPITTEMSVVLLRKHGTFDLS